MTGSHIRKGLLELWRVWKQLPLFQYDHFSEEGLLKGR